VLTPHPGEMARLAGIKGGRGAGESAGGCAGFCTADGRDAGAERGANADCAPGWTRGCEYYRESGDGQGRQRRLAHRGDCGVAGAVSDGDGAGGGAAVYLHGLAADMAVREADEHTLLATDSLRYFSRAFRFESRGSNGYVWLQGAFDAAAPREDLE